MKMIRNLREVQRIARRRRVPGRGRARRREGTTDRPQRGHHPPFYGETMKIELAEARSHLAQLIHRANDGENVIVVAGRWDRRPARAGRTGTATMLWKRARLVRDA
jgi:hypothetical protein